MVDWDTLSPTPLRLMVMPLTVVHCSYNVCHQPLWFSLLGLFDICC